VRDAAGSAVACAQFAVEDQMVGLYDVFTAPPARGKGLSRRLCAFLLRQAALQGARLGYLQVDAENHPARAVYAHLGFTDAYRYHYRSPPSAPAELTGRL
jgi:GNAT superfamily N-acetyltransferase